MRAALTLPRVSEADPRRWPGTANVLTMATANGAAIMGYPDRRAAITPGAPADIVLLRRATTAASMGQDTIDGFIAQAGREAIASVMIDGRWVLRDDRIESFDEARMLAAVSDAHAGIAERAATIIPAIDRGRASIGAQLRSWLAPFDAPLHSTAADPATVSF
jgi:cytosine/adenosine deaminase-related metal-dependent hydrolase